MSTSSEATAYSPTHSSDLSAPPPGLCPLTQETPAPRRVQGPGAGSEWLELVTPSLSSGLGRTRYGVVGRGLGVCETRRALSLRWSAGFCRYRTLDHFLEVLRRDSSTQEGVLWQGALSLPQSCSRMARCCQAEGPGSPRASCLWSIPLSLFLLSPPQQAEWEPASPGRG